MRLLVATSNAGKAREFEEILRGSPALGGLPALGGSPGLGGLPGSSGVSEFVDLKGLSAGRAVEPPEETGATFRANACLKAAYYARAFGTFTLADDSGLAVDALGGKPGVESARWAQLHGRGQGDGDNNRLLLEQIESVEDAKRTARFMCVLALADPQGVILVTAQDSVEGVILRSPRGSNGFGYDPLFLIGELGKTTAELEPAAKHAISHRGRALRRLRAVLEQARIAG